MFGLPDIPDEPVLQKLKKIGVRPREVNNVPSTAKSVLGAGSAIAVAAALITGQPVMMALRVGDTNPIRM
jgi:hypothetical protein